jgi:hypothetical protein
MIGVISPQNPPVAGGFSDIAWFRSIKLLQVRCWTRKTLSCYAVLVFVTAGSLRGQAVSAGNPIIGVWKLNVEKSKDAMPLPESEVITIVSRDTSYRLTFDIKQSNGYNPKYDIVTDVKGATVKPIYADGRGSNDVWRVTRQGKKAFDMELNTQFGGWTDKYEVSSDGKTMTLHRVRNNKGMVGGYIEKDGTVPRLSEYVALFEHLDQ